MVSCPDLGRPSRKTDLTEQHQGPLAIRESARNYRSTSNRKNPYRRNPRGGMLYRSNSVSTGAPISDALRVQGRDRRRMSRISCEVVSESATCSPPFNTPTPGSRPSSHLIAIAGMMIAVGQLDRLSSMANERLGIPLTKQRIYTSPVIKTITKAPPNTPITLSGLSSVSPSYPSTPFVPPNSPMAPEDAPTLQETNQGRRVRPKRAYSRLSEVYSPKDLLDTQSRRLDLESIPQLLDIYQTPLRLTPASPVSPGSRAIAAAYFTGADSSSIPASELKSRAHGLRRSLTALEYDHVESNTPEPGPSSAIYQRRGIRLHALSVGDSKGSNSWSDLWESKQRWDATPGAESSYTVQHHEFAHQSDTSSLSQGARHDDEIAWLDSEDDSQSGK